ncbi:MAG: hypothetical protein EXX96DRAFT_573955 [Benjaminiella poitrasii]|nr:MAG: hypothetical protein EXX96DRAFT_573955 [Benjaminiella poitrasii]
MFNPPGIQEDLTELKTNNNGNSSLYHQASKSIKIPTSSTNHYNNSNNNISYMPNHFQDLYDDILSFTSDNDIDLEQISKYNEEDPMEDPYFMAFLSSISSSEPTLSSHRYYTSQQQQQLQQTPIFPLQHQASQSFSPFHAPNSPQSSPSPSIDHNPTPKHKKRQSAEHPQPKKATKIGYCEHPKHVLYRQERHVVVSSQQGTGSSDVSSIMKATPRRGRPPKGSKATDFIYSSSASGFTSGFAYQDHYYPIVELTVRPLPKRLEAVVGKSNIKVCLTCLKRSDLDPDYLNDKAYVGPQQLSKRRK